MANSLLVFVVGATASLLTSWVLVTRLERIGSRIGFSEALLGLVAAFAADAPEITAAVTALAHHQQAVGAGVVIGSNVFNLAALLGLGAFVAGRVDLHRKVVLLSGAIAMFVALVCLLAVARVISPLAALVAVLVVVVPYVSRPRRSGTVDRALDPRSCGDVAQLGRRRRGDRAGGGDPPETGPAS